MIAQISRSFVPVAVNLYEVRQAKDAGGELFRSIQSQKDRYQGIWIVSPDGKVLAYLDWKDRDPKVEAREMLAAVAAVLKDFGKVTPRQTKPVDHYTGRGRGVGVRPDDSVTLAVYTRYMLGGGRTSAPAKYPVGKLYEWDGELRSDGGAVVDSITLTAKEWATLSPPKAEAGTPWTVPEAVSGMFYRVISPISDASHLVGRKLTVNQLKAQVEAIDAGPARIRLTGQWQTDHLYEGGRIRMRTAGEGIALYDLKQQKMLSLLFVCRGVMLDAKGQPVRPTGAVVEWQAERPATRLP